MLLDVQSSSQIIAINKPEASFLHAERPSCRPTNSVRALEGIPSSKRVIIVTACAQLGTLVSTLTVISLSPTKLSSLSKSCYYHIRELRCIRPYLDFKTASTIATSTVHSKLDYCNSLYYNLPKSQTNRLQVIQNSLSRAVVKAPKFCHVTPILRSLHWLKIN